MVTRNALPSQAYLRSIFDYNENTGDLIWKVKRRGKVMPGKIAGTIVNGSYIKMKLCGIQTYAHRVVWKWLYDEEPTHIDHINGDKQDNRKLNLRLSDPSINIATKVSTNSSHSGVNGVSWEKDNYVWRAKIKVHNVRTDLGYYESFWDAVVARRNAEVEAFGCTRLDRLISQSRPELGASLPSFPLDADGSPLAG